VIDARDRSMNEVGNSKTALESASQPNESALGGFEIGKDFCSAWAPSENLCGPVFGLRNEVTRRLKRCEEKVADLTLLATARPVRLFLRRLLSESLKLITSNPAALGLVRCSKIPIHFRGCHGAA
jgi:hypothetical protein